MPKQPDRRCGTCKWWRPELTAKGNVMRSRPGRCDYEIVLPPMPEVARIGGHPAKEARMNMGAAWPDFGTDCPTWEAKP